MRYIQAMTRAREAVAAEFLRKALAVEPLGVRKLNAMARAAGLLSERQRITDAKVFRRAKTCLGYDPSATASGYAADGLGSCRAVARKARLVRHRSARS